MAKGTSRVTTDELSRYLDAELDSRGMLRLELELSASDAARQRLDELRSAVQALRSLERPAPPPELYSVLQRRLGLARGPRGLRAKLQNRRQRYLALRPPVYVLVGVFVALGFVVLLLFRTAEAPRAGASAPGAALERTVEERHFVYQAGGWQEEGLTEGPYRGLRAESAEGRALLTAQPWLNVFLRDGLLEAPVRFVLEGERLELVP